MDAIYFANESFDFNKIGMLSPVVITGGNSFIKFRVNGEPLYIQTPKCKVKQGFIKSGKKLYCDFVFSREDEEFICWMEKLEIYCQKKLYENREKWFETTLDEHDIENSFASPLKLYKSGKFYISRTNVPNLLGNTLLKIYDENEKPVSPENLSEDMDVISILEIQGIKCSARTFQIEMEIKQMLVMTPVNLFDKCILLKGGRVSSTGHAATAATAATVATAATSAANMSSSSSNDTSSMSIQVNMEVPSNNDVSNEVSIEAQNEDFNEVYKAALPHIVATSNEVSNESQNAYEVENNDDKDDKLEDEDDDLEDDVDDDDYDDEYENPRIVINHDDNNMIEIDLDLDDLQDDVVNIKKRDDIYYEMYREAKRKAKLARDLAIASYLEAKNIKNTYMIVDDDSDLEDESFQNME